MLSNRKKYKSTFFLFLILSSCVSSTIINTVPSKAKVFIDNEYKGETPLKYSDNKISWSQTEVRIEKEGYETFSTFFKRNEQVNSGAIVAGVFLFWPYLWVMEYNPERTYNLKRNNYVALPEVDSSELSISKQINLVQINSEKSAVKSKKYQALQQLKEMYNDSIFTKEEYESERNKILDPYGKYGWPVTFPVPVRKYKKLIELRAVEKEGLINKEELNNEKRKIVGSNFYKFYVKGAKR
jgi:hypothetical protein